MEKGKERRLMSEFGDWGECMQVGCSRGVGWRRGEKKRKENKREEEEKEGERVVIREGTIEVGVWSGLRVAGRA